MMDMPSGPMAQKAKRTFHHAHTASLPVDPTPLLLPNNTHNNKNHPLVNTDSSMATSTTTAVKNNNSNSSSNFTSHLQQHNCSQQQHLQQAAPDHDNKKTPHPHPNPNHYHHKSNHHLGPSLAHQSQSNNSHVRTFSLPFVDPQNAASSSNDDGNMPLPTGWRAELTPTGQTYYVNLITKQTTWDDPRKVNNFSTTNQAEITSDKQSFQNAIKSIPLPAGWEEAKTPTGESYFINHNSQATSWEDPRLEIYTQQQKQQQQQEQNNMPFNNGPSSSVSCGSSSVSSLFGPTSSSTSSCSSLSSASMFNSNLKTAATDSSKSSANKPELKIRENNVSGGESIESMQYTLSQLSEQKTAICNQLQELSKQEMDLKAKLTAQDLDDILKMLKNNTSHKKDQPTTNKNDNNIIKCEPKLSSHHHNSTLTDHPKNLTQNAV